MDRPDRERVACLVCGRRTRAGCMLVIKNLSCHWCEEALELADQLLALFNEEEIRKQQQVEDTKYYAEKMKEVIDRVREEAKREELERIYEWGDELCPHHDEKASQRNYDRKRECPRCWQALKEGQGKSCGDSLNERYQRIVKKMKEQ